ncbi:MAG: Fe-S cluster assembly protein SufD [Pseudomonadota bacterium]
MSIQKTHSEEALGMSLPTRKVESFHYTDLRALIRELPEPVKLADTGGDNYQRIMPAVRLPFYDGQFFADIADELPEGVTVTNGVAKANSTDINDAIIGMNAAMHGDAILIKIDGDGTSEVPLGLAHVANSNGATACFHRVEVAKGVTAQIIDRCVSGSNINHLSNSVSELTVGEGAKVDWFIIQQENEDASRLARLDVDLAADSELSIFILNAGGKLVRQEIKIGVNGENSNLAIRGVNLVGDNSHIDVTTILEHNVPHTNAEELFRNVVAGDGHGVFQGQIKVAQPAQKTDAQMACNTLLLTDEGDFSAKPELEIFADDVICAHGATVTDIDDEQLFYLRARGIDEKTSRSLLIKAFVDEVVEELETSEIMQDALTSIIDNWLDENI